MLPRAGRIDVQYGLDRGKLELPAHLGKLLIYVDIHSHKRESHQGPS